MSLRSQILVHKQALPEPDQALPGRPTPVAVPEAHYVNGNPLQPPFPNGLQQAIFALGCFWGAERRFWEQEGVWTTAVGYAGGLTPNPSYEEVCSGLTGHTEAVLVVFDPQIISYAALLKLFWEAHNPTQGMRQRSITPRLITSNTWPRIRAVIAVSPAPVSACHHELGELSSPPSLECTSEQKKKTPPRRGFCRLNPDIRDFRRPGVVPLTSVLK